jgi:hypothetical protein
MKGMVVSWVKVTDPKDPYGGLDYLCIYRRVFQPKAG